MSTQATQQFNEEDASWDYAKCGVNFLCQQGRPRGLAYLESEIKNLEKIPAY